jgi:ubiquitin-protein ligase E3 C
MFGFMHGEGFEIRRDFLLEDAFEKLYPMQEAVKDRLRIQFVDSNYIIEDGVDGGGLFKEFLTKLTERVFDPQFAFFAETSIERRLYPNYLSAKTNPNYLK